MSLATLTAMGCSSLLFFPTSYKYVDDTKLPFKPLELTVDLADGTTIVFWSFKSPVQPPKARILMFHGNGQNLSAHFTALYWLVELGYDLVVFDYPGYGASGGAPNPQNAVESGRAVLQWMRNQKSRAPIVVYGQSLGGALAFKALLLEKDRHDICLAVADSTFLRFTSVASDLIASQLWTLPFSWLPYVVLSDRYAPKADIKNLAPLPIFVLHGDQDRIVRLKRGQELYSNASEPKSWFLDKDGQHIGAFNGPNKEAARARLVQELSTHCNRQIVAY